MMKTAFFPIALATVAAFACSRAPSANAPVEGSRGGVKLRELEVVHVGMDAEDVKSVLERLAPHAEYRAGRLTVALDDERFQRLRCAVHSTDKWVTDCSLDAKKNSADLAAIERHALAIGGLLGVQPRRFEMDPVLGTYTWKLGVWPTDIARVKSLVTVSPEFTADGKSATSFTIVFGHLSPPDRSGFPEADRAFQAVLRGLLNGASSASEVPSAPPAPPEKPPVRAPEGGGVLGGEIRVLDPSKAPKNVLDALASGALRVCAVDSRAFMAASTKGWTAAAKADVAKRSYCVPVVGAAGAKAGFEIGVPAGSFLVQLEGHGDVGFCGAGEGGESTVFKIGAGDVVRRAHIEQCDY